MRFRIGSGRLWQRAALCALAGTIVLLASGCPLGGGNNAPAQVLVIAVRADEGSPAVAALFGDPYEFDAGMTAGRYYIVAVNGDGAMMDLGFVEVKEGASLVSARFSGRSDDPKLAEALGTLGSFLAETELLRLATLEAASEGFTFPLFDERVSIDRTTYERWYEAAIALGDREKGVMGAIETIEPRLQARSNVRLAGLAAPPAGLFERLSDALLPALFNRMRTLGERERGRVNAIIDQIGAVERREVFDGLPANLRGGASDFDEWRRMVRSGQLDDSMGAIHGYLQAVAPDATSSSGQTLGRAMADEGGPLLESGVDLMAQGYGRVPHVAKALEVTNKAREWESYARRLYEDPEAGVGDILRGPYRDFVKDRIRDDLRQSMPDAPDKVIDALASQLARGIVAAVAGKPAAVAARSEATRTPVDAAPASAIETPAAGSWVDQIVGEIAQRLLDEGYSGIEVALVTTDLEACLNFELSAGQTQDGALLACAAIIEHARELPTPCPTPDRGESGTGSIADVFDCADAEQLSTATATPPPPSTNTSAPAVTPTPKPTCGSFDPGCSLGAR
jgi:hypothetical protein